jgi:hypothetical protein
MRSANNPFLLEKSIIDSITIIVIAAIRNTLAIKNRTGKKYPKKNSRTITVAAKRNLEVR